MDYAIAAQPMPEWAVPLVIFVALIAFGVVMLIQVCFFWLISKFVTPATGTFRNAWRYLGYRILLGIAAIAVFIAFGRVSLHYIDPKSGGFLMLVGISVIAMWVALLFFIFKILMHVYEISFLKALEFEVVMIVIGAGLAVLEMIFLPHYRPLETTAARQNQQEAIHQILNALGGQKMTSALPMLTPAEAATTASPPPPVRTEVTLTEPVQITVPLDGTNSGSVTLPAGTKLKYFSVQGDRVRVQYLQTVTTVPRKSTDLGPAAP